MKVTITNFQSLRKVELYIKGLTVIVGSSNVGKSALVRAINSLFFGRGGESFVSWGERTTTIEGVDIPTSDKDKTINIKWEKGGGENKFTIDGEKYDKVSVDVPLPVQVAGFKDIQVGSEYIRPQLHDQIRDRAFLVDRPGSFIHDAIAQASRLSVLLKADRACSGDLKRTKSLLKVRNEDLALAKTKLEGMEPVKEFYKRIQAVKVKSAAIKKVGARLDDLKAMASSRVGLKVVSTLTIPEKVPFPVDLGSKEILISQLAVERKNYLTLPSIPPERKIDISGIEQLVSNLPTISSLAKERRKVLIEYGAAESSLRSITDESDIAEANLATLLSSITICPVCERPMEPLHAEVHSN